MTVDLREYNLFERKTKKYLELEKNKFKTKSKRSFSLLKVEAIEERGKPPEIVA